MNQSVLIISIAVGAVVIIALIIWYTLHSAKKHRDTLNAIFGQKPEAAAFPKNIGQYWRLKLAQQEDIPHVDDITWADLDMDKVYHRINACQTSVGEQVLFAILHQPLFDYQALQQREQLMNTLDANPSLRLDLQVILSKMGKAQYNTLASFCGDISAKKIKYPYLFTVLAALPIIMIGLIFISVPIGVTGLALSVITNGVVYYKTKMRVEQELSAIRYFSSMLWCTQKILKKTSRNNPVLVDLAKSFNVFKNLGGKMSGMLRQKLNDVDFFVEYVRILFLSNLRNYNKVLDTIEKNTKVFSTLYQCFGELDALIAILSFRKCLPFYTCPDFKNDNNFDIEDIYHPLLDDPVTNSVMLPSHNLISGSNASGKSTFIKAVAINGILAQTIHTCTAKCFRARPALVITSMAVRDNITAGESYFITEIKSLKRILETIPKVHCICVIDEILKGTNTTERIAASASVLRYLAQQDCMCIVATHDLELTRLLADQYVNHHFSEQIKGSGIEFDYIIKVGSSKTKNAISLLSFLGFQQQIVTDANQLVEMFEQTKQWPLRN